MITPVPNFEGRAVLVRGRRWLLGVGAFLEVFGLGIVARHFFDWEDRFGVMTGAVLCSVAPILFILYGWSARKWASREALTLRVGAEGLRLGSMLLPRSEVSTGYLLASPENAVRLLRRGRLAEPVDVELSSRRDAVALLESMGLGVRQSTARFQAVYGGLTRRALTAVGVGFALLLLLVLVMVVVDGFTGRGTPPGSLRSR